METCPVCRLWTDQCRGHAPGDAARVAEYLAAVVELGKRYGYSLGHEDGHGGFIVEVYSDHNAEWLKDARPDLPPPPASPESILAAVRAKR